MLISIKPDTKLGYYTLRPVDVEDVLYVRSTNKHSGESRAFMQFEDEINLVRSLLNEYQLGELDFGNTIRVDIDEHTYRHMVGGQSD